MKTTKKKTQRKAAPAVSPIGDAASEPNVAERMAEVQKHLGALSVAASLDGNEEAARAIVSLAAALCGDVRGIACAQPRLADAIARERVSWPILCDVHPDMRRRALRWLNVLPLGENSGWKRPGRKPYSFNTVINETLRVALAVLATKGERATFERALTVIENQGPVEKSKSLRPLGISFAEGKQDTCPRGSQSYEANVRAGILDRLRKAWRAMLTVAEE